MIYLHLTPGFRPVCSTAPALAFETLTFHGGEPHFRLLAPLPVDADVTITIRLNSFADVGLLLVATDALRRAGAGRINLFCPYFPAARQDRVMVPGEPLTVKVYADLINAQHYHRVAVFDPHSDVTPALLNRVQVISNTAFVSQCLADFDNYCLVAPDAGALKKIYPLSAALGGVEVLECSKKRDIRTGHLSGFHVPEKALNGRDCVIVDDICDGGGTFVGLAEALKERGAGDLYLVVSHGIFSQQFEGLRPWFHRIFTTDSIRNTSVQTPDFVRCLPLTSPF